MSGDIMADLGADYSWARPGGTALAQAGVISVGRYLGNPGDGRIIEKAEYDDLTDAGLSVWFVREGDAASMLDGYDLGVSHAQSAVANLERLGLSDQVVYAAADFDVDPSQYAACDDYLRGFASIVGAGRTGIYAGMRYINHCRDAGLAFWFWQAGATSWNHGETGMVHIEQTTRTPPVAGTDHNFIHETIHGQVGSGTAPTSKKEIVLTLGEETMSAPIYARGDQLDVWYALYTNCQDSTVPRDSGQIYSGRRKVSAGERAIVEGYQKQTGKLHPLSDQTAVVVIPQATFDSINKVQGADA